MAEGRGVDRVGKWSGQGWAVEQERALEQEWAGMGEVGGVATTSSSGSPLPPLTASTSASPAACRARYPGA